MKKILFLITVVFAALFISSCSKEGVSLTIKSKNLVGTWALAHGYFYEEDDETGEEEYVEMDIVEPPFNRKDRVYESDFTDDLFRYQEIVFTEYSMMVYEWDGDNYDEEKDESYAVWFSYFGELEYHIRDNAIWIIGIKAYTIKKLTTKELILWDGEDETTIEVYHKKK